jgi:rare lipoprotein A
MRATSVLMVGFAIVLALATAARAADARQFSGVAAYYDKNYSGRTASGATYDPKKFTCAHRTLPFGTHVRVTDLKTRRSVEVVVNDRGPFTKNRVIDLSLAAAEALGMTGRGLIKVMATVE